MEGRRKTTPGDSPTCGWSLLADRPTHLGEWWGGRFIKYLDGIGGETTHHRRERGPANRAAPASDGIKRVHFISFQISKLQ